MKQQERQRTGMTQSKTTVYLIGIKYLVVKSAL